MDTNKTRLAAVVVVVVVGLAVVGVARRPWAQRSDTATGTGAATMNVTKDSAVDFAAGLLVEQVGLTADPDGDAAGAMEAVAASGARDRLVESVAEYERELWSRLAGRTGDPVVFPSVLGSVVDAFDAHAGRAQVRVWMVVAAAVPGVVGPVAEWRTYALDLVWADQPGWQLWSYEWSDGPTPDVPADIDVMIDPATFAAAVEDLESWSTR